MACVPLLSELGKDDKLVLEFENVSCLAGTSGWILEFNGRDPSSLQIRTVGRMVIPRKKMIALNNEQRSQIGRLIRGLDSYFPGSTSHCNFRVSLTRGVEHIACWEFRCVSPTLEHLESHQSLVVLCRTVQHEYRRPTVRENISSTVFLVGVVIVFILGLLLSELWSPVDRLRGWLVH